MAGLLLWGIDKMKLVWYYRTIGFIKIQNFVDLKERDMTFAFVVAFIVFWLVILLAVMGGFVDEPEVWFVAFFVAVVVFIFCGMFVASSCETASKVNAVTPIQLDLLGENYGPDVYLEKIEGKEGSSTVFVFRADGKQDSITEDENVQVVFDGKNFLEKIETNTTSTFGDQCNLQSWRYIFHLPENGMYILPSE